MKEFIKKNYLLVIFLITITVIRFCFVFNIPIYYLKNLRFDDQLMVDLANNLSNGLYLGSYNATTLTKGIFYPLILFLTTKMNIPYDIFMTIFYILGVIFLCFSLRKLVKKPLIIVIYVLLLFNPISYSMEVFQRLYRSSIVLIETLFFLSFIFRIISNIKNRNILNYIMLGFITTIMLLTREDNIWTLVIILFLVIYHVIKTKKLKTCLVILTPFITIILGLNLVSYINYQHYQIYTYNELNYSSFKNFYLKLQQVDDNQKYPRVAVTKNTLYKLIEHTERFNFTKEEIDDLYLTWADKDTKEINNGNIIWSLRDIIFEKEDFQNGVESTKYFDDLSNEIDKLFKNGTFKKKIQIPIILINMPTHKVIKQLPLKTLQTIKYVTTFDKIKTVNNFNDLRGSIVEYQNKYEAYGIYYDDYLSSENLSRHEIVLFSNIRDIYKIIISIFSIIGIILYSLSLFKRNNPLHIFNTLLLISYLLIILGVTYTDLTAFRAIRYLYLGPTYLLQTLFIVLVWEVVIDEKIIVNYFNALFKRRKNH